MGSFGSPTKPYEAGRAAASERSLPITWAGVMPAQAIAKLRSDAAARPASYGFVGDPYNPITTSGLNSKTLYYGHLVYAGGIEPARSDFAVLYSLKCRGLHTPTVRR